MKKFAKMSLAAAVAVVGLSSTASATSLEEAIKGVDISGQFRYRFNEINSDHNTNANASDTGSDVEIEVTAKIPVNDMVSAIIKVDNANDDADKTPSTKGGVTIEDYYFQYVNGAVTVNAGQHNIAGRMTDGAQGDGVTALYNFGQFTVGGALFANHNVNDTEIDGTSIEGSGVASVIAMGSVGPVSLLAQYASVADTMNSYNLKADATFGPVTAGLEYTASKLDNVAATILTQTNAKNDRDTFKAYVSGSMDIFSATLAYAKTGDNGSGAIDSQITNEGLETPSEFLLWNLGTSNNADMDVWALDASVQVTEKVALRAAYADGEIGNGAGNDVDEVLVQATYKMSDNLTTYVRYAEFDNSAADDNDNERARIEVKYTF